MLRPRSLNLNRNLTSKINQSEASFRSCDILPGLPLVQILLLSGILLPFNLTLDSPQV